MSPFAFGVTTLAGELGAGGGDVMNPKSNQTLWLRVGTESYVTITWEDFSNVSRVPLTFTVENEVAPLHTYSDLRKREKLGILSVVTVRSL